MKTIDGVHVLTAEGTAREVGLAHGSEAGELVKKTIAAYQTMFENQGIAWKKANAIARTYIPAITDYNPEFIEEMEGIAEGAGVPFDDILTLNCRSEITFQSGSTNTDGCTTVSVTPERAEHGDTLLCQTWDWKMALRECVLLLRVKKPGKPEIITLVEAGTLAKMGMNSAGVGILLNALASDCKAEGVPLLLALRGILEADNFCHAVAAATKKRVACCGNVMMATRDGEALDIELAGEDFDVLYPKESILVHTNHFVSNRVPRYPYKDTMKFGAASSFMRRGRVDKLLRMVEGPIGLSDIKRVFSDHADYPNGICSHENPTEPKADRYCTTCCVLMNLTKGEIHVCPANPCDTPFVKFTF
ncbi:acyl-CoA--6-aminopenicillanic acid acyl-transferase [Christensenellaceae bacterium NSJ-63]|uniref:Acyl-CoA--6-aminopenicillanic acid acyl-transferase n=1 Tax=Guopingia tenuis TaxID=2763656 RepID=A0A926HSQ5_9FIRM|nr:C45 family peptidase [Guopingia tenuis]MBC8538712.1 acyl-CoA--6-aminopenicillanic acid acyl-transferase [Guopingia tenuis]